MTSGDTVMKTIRERGGDLRVATAFLTRLPLRLKGEEVLAEAAWTFPVVGAGIGLAAGGGLAAASWLGLHPLACALIGLMVAVLLTGGLHEDGLADTADGFGGGTTRDDKLRIMRDSRTGAYGVMAVVFSIGIRAALISGLFSPQLAVLALIVAHGVSRAMVVAVMAVLDPARTDGLGVGVGNPSMNGVMAALVIGAVLALMLTGFATGLWVIVAATLSVAVFAALSRSQIGGHTGDVLGAVQQVAEVAVLVAIAGASV